MVRSVDDLFDTSFAVAGPGWCDERGVVLIDWRARDCAHQLTAHVFAERQLCDTHSIDC
jgi:hypothetical protein